MTTVVRVVAAAIGLQVAVGAAPPQRETAARPAFEAATIKLSTGPSRANIVTQPAPNHLAIPGMALKALIYVAYGDAADVARWYCWCRNFGSQAGGPPRDLAPAFNRAE